MSDPQATPISAVVSARASHVVNVTGIEVSYEASQKSKRGKYPISIIIMISGKITNESRKYQKDQEILWDLKKQFSSEVEFTIVIREHHRIKRRDRFVRTTVSAAAMIMKPVFVVDKLNGEEMREMTLSIHCDTAGPFVELVRQLVEEAQNRLSSMKPFIEQLGKVCEALNILVTISEPLGDSHPAVKAATGIATRLYEKCKSMQECHVSANTLMEDVANFFPFTDIPLERCKSTATAQTAESLLEAFGEMSRAIIDSSDGRILGFLLSYRLEEVNGYKERFRRLKETFDWCVKTEIWKTVLHIETYTANLLLTLLRPVNSAFYVTEKSCFEGTRKDTLDIIERWSSSDSNLFWLYGSEGSGKSTIAHTVARMFDEQNRLAGSFFSDGCDRDRRNSVSIIPTIAYQLAKWHEPYFSLILDLLSGHAERNVHNSLVSQINLLMGEPLTTLAKPSMAKHQPPPHRSLVIVLDALEQCCDSGHSLRYLVRYIRDIAKLVPWLKVFVSSRKLPEFDVFSGTDCQELDISDPLVDFEYDIASCAKYCANDATFQVERSHAVDYGMPGLLARIEQLSRRLGPLATDNDHAKKAVQAEERGMDELFHLSILAIMTRSAYGEEVIPIIRDVLAIVAYVTSTSEKAPTKDMVLHYLAPFWPEVTPDALRDIINSLRPILSQNGAKVRILFPANLFLDMVSDERRSGAFLADIGLVKHQLARGCLDEMDRHLRFNICGLESPYLPNKEVENLAERIESCIPEMLRYSCLSWIDLVVECGDAQALSRLVAVILYSPKIFVWLEVLSVIGRFDVAKNLSKLIDKYKEHNDICTAAKELRDFVSSSYSAMELSAPHAYISALAWLPNSLVLSGHTLNPGSSCPRIVIESFTNSETTKNRIDSEDDIASVACSFDGNRIVSGHRDGTLNIWDGRTGARVHGPLRGHSTFVRCGPFCLDGSRFISGSYDGSLRIWDTLSGEFVSGPFRADSATVSAALSPDGTRIVSGDEDGRIRIWNAETGDVIVKSSEHHKYSVRSVAYSPDGSRIVTGSDDKTIRIWDGKIGKSIGSPLTGDDDWIMVVAYSPDSSRIVSASIDKTVRIWDAQTGEQLGKPLWHKSHVIDVGYSRDGSRILSSSGHEMICMWDSNNGILLGVIPRNESRWDPEKQRFVSIPCWWPKANSYAQSLLSVDSLVFSANPLYIPDDGWIRTLDGGLLLWVPPEHRGCECHTTRDSTITKDEQDERLSNSEWGKLVQGKDWARVMGVERKA